MDIGNGFAELAEELASISNKVTDENIRHKALEAGATPVVDRAKRIISTHRKTGNLENSISSEYNNTTKTQDVGWGKDGFYGRFYEKGYKPVKGKRKNGKLINKAPSGKLIKAEHIKPAYEAEKENIANAMLDVYKQEIGG